MENTDTSAPVRLVFGKYTSDQLMSLNLEYPWWASGRAALCRIMMQMSGREISEGIFRDSLLYFPDGSYVAKCFTSSGTKDYKDKDLAEVIRTAISEKSNVYVAGSDFFTKEDYDNVRQEQDGRISRIAVVDYSAPFPSGSGAERADDPMEFVSETLAQIYMDQGYPQQAKEIYEKLILLNPEKSAYFASLIEKL